MPQQQEQSPQTPVVDEAAPGRGSPSVGAVVQGLLGGVPLTWLACLLAVWADRPYVPSLLTRLAYPAAVVVGCLGTLGWTRLVTGRRSTPELELTVVVLSLAVAVLALALLMAFIR